MHDLDRALQEFESDEGSFGAYEFDQESEAAHGYEAESAGEAEAFDGEREYDGEYQAEMEGEGDGEREYDQEGMFEAESEAAAPGDSEGLFDEVEEMEHAAGLLEVQDEGELDHFLGGLVNKVRKSLGAYLPPGVEQALAKTLKNVARAALPKVGAAVGNFVVPGLGGAVGAGIASNAGKMFGLELEGMSHEDQEFEVARRIVNLGVEATKAAAQSAAGGPSPQAAKDAILQAAATHAPGLASAAGQYPAAAFAAPTRSGGGRWKRSGRWFRRGHRIILVGV